MRGRALLTRKHLAEGRQEVAALGCKLRLLDPAAAVAGRRLQPLLPLRQKFGLVIVDQL